MLFEGHTYPSACQVSWLNLVNEFVAGTKAYLSVIPKDAFGNNISSIDGPKADYFMVSASYENGTAAVVLDFRYNGWSEVGYIGLEFVPITSGRLLLHVYGDNQTCGSPLPFLVKPGWLLSCKNIYLIYFIGCVVISFLGLSVDLFDIFYGLLINSNLLVYSSRL